MAARGKAITLTYFAWNTSDNAYQPVDAANHTLWLIRDGVCDSPTNLPEDVAEQSSSSSSGTCNDCGDVGACRIALTAAEMDARSITISGCSTTADVVIIPVSVTTYPGELDDIFDGTGAVVTLLKLVVNANNAAGGIDIDNSGGPGIKVDGTTFGITARSSGGPAIHGLGDDYGISLSGGTRGLLAGGSNGGILAVGGVAGPGFECTGTDEGFVATGSGNSAGMKITGGLTGIGLDINGGGTSGVGLSIDSTSGAAVDISAASGMGVDIDGSSGGVAIDASGGIAVDVTAAAGVAVDIDGTTGGVWVNASNGNAVKYQSDGGNGHGLIVIGDGSGSGLFVQGTAAGINVSATTVGVLVNAATGVDVNGTTAGMTIDGGSAAGLHVGGAAFGVEVTASAGPGISAVASAGNDNGITVAGFGTGNGMELTGGATGHGLHTLGGATSGDGFRTEAQLLGAGLEAIGAGGGFDISGSIAAYNPLRAVMVDDTGSDTDRGTALRAAYAIAQGMSPTSTDRVTVVLPPGRYKLTTPLDLDTDYIDLVALEPESGGDRMPTDDDLEGVSGPSSLDTYKPPKTEVYNEESAITTVTQSAANVWLKGFAIAQLNDTNVTPTEYHAFHCNIADNVGNVGSLYEQMYFWVRTFQEPANPHYSVAFDEHVKGTWKNCKANAGAWRIGSLTDSGKATLTTALAGANNDIDYIAFAAGAAGNSTTIEYLNPGGNGALIVTIAGSDITVTLERVGGVIASIASEVIGAVLAATFGSLLGPPVNAAGNDGTGLVTTLVRTNLTGGYTPDPVFSATMYDCEAGVFSFIGSLGDAVDCRLVRCQSVGISSGHSTQGANSFGSGGASKTLGSSCYFEDCIAGDESFGFARTAASAFVRCRAGDDSFGSRIEFSGYAEDCIAGRNSFGGRIADAVAVLSGTLVRCVAKGADLPWRVEGATIEDSFLSIDTNNQACITLLADDTTTITNSTILVVEGGTGIPIHAAVAQNVAAVGNRYNNRSVAINGLGSTVTNVAGVPEVDVTYWLGTAAEADVAGVPNMNVIQINGALTDGSPAIANRPILRLQQLDLHCDINAQGAFQAVNNSANGYGFNMYGGVAGCRQQGDLYGCAQYGGTADLFLGDSGTIENAAGNVIQIGAELAAPVIVNEWETQSQADPTGFHVNVLEIEGSDATDILLAAAQAAIVANHLDHLFAVTYDPAAKPGVADALLNEIIESDGGVSRFTGNSLEQVLIHSADSVEDEADTRSLAATVLMSTHAVMTTATNLQVRKNDNSAFNNYTVTIDPAAKPMTGIS